MGQTSRGRERAGEGTTDHIEPRRKEEGGGREEGRGREGKEQQEQHEQHEQQDCSSRIATAGLEQQDCSSRRGSTPRLWQRRGRERRRRRRAGADADAEAALLPPARALLSPDQGRETSLPGARGPPNALQSPCAINSFNSELDFKFKLFFLGDRLAHRISFLTSSSSGLSVRYLVAVATVAIAFLLSTTFSLFEKSLCGCNLSDRTENNYGIQNCRRHLDEFSTCSESVLFRPRKVIVRFFFVWIVPDWV